MLKTYWTYAIWTISSFNFSLKHCHVGLNKGEREAFLPHARTTPSSVQLLLSANFDAVPPSLTSKRKRIFDPHVSSKKRKTILEEVFETKPPISLSDLTMEIHSINRFSTLVWWSACTENLSCISIYKDCQKLIAVEPPKAGGYNLNAHWFKGISIFWL